MICALKRLFVATAVGVALALPTTPAALAQEVAPLDVESAEFVVLNLINLLRLEHGVRPLELDGTLTEMARMRSADMADRGQIEMDHMIPGLGYGPLWLLSQLVGARGTGENLGVTDARNEVAMWSLFNSWVASPSHLENLLRPEFNRVGVGVVEVPSWVPGRTMKYVTQYFAIANGPVSRV